MMLKLIIEQIIHQFKIGNFAWGYQIYQKMRKAMEKERVSASEQAKILNELSNRIENELLRQLPNIEKWPLVSNMTALCFEIFEETGNLQKISDLGLEVIRMLTRTKAAKSQELADFMDALIDTMLQSKNYRMATESLFASIIFKSRVKKTKNIMTICRIFESFLEKISPDDGALIIYCILLNSFRMVMPESLVGEEFQNQLLAFISSVYRLIGDLLGNIARESLSRVNMMFKRNQDLFSNRQFIDNLLLKLFLLKEYDWTYTLFSSYYRYLLQKQTQTPELMEYMNIYIERAINFGGLRIAFDAYSELSKLIIDQTAFQSGKANLWSEVSEIFRRYNNRHLFAASLENLKSVIKSQDTVEDIKQFLFYKNKLFTLQLGILEPSLDDILYALLYRSLYELKSYNLSRFLLNLIAKTINTEIEPNQQKVIPMKNFNNSSLTISNLAIEPKSTEFIRALEAIVEESKANVNPALQKMNEQDVIRSIIQIHDNYISVQSIAGSFEKPVLNSNISIEEPIPFEILTKYYQLFAEEFSKIFYLLLPLNLRNYLKVMESNKGVLHEILIVSDRPELFAFEYIEDESEFFIGKYCFGYHFGPFNEYPAFYSVNRDLPKQKSVLLIGNLNEKVPTIYNHKIKNEEAALKSPQLTELFRNLQINLKNVSGNLDIDVINFSNGSLDEILQKIESKSYSIIHIMNPIISSDISPLDSYFITADFQTLTLRRLQTSIEKQIASQASSGRSQRFPLLILDSELSLENRLSANQYKEKIYNIISKLKESNFSGLIGRIEPSYHSNCLTILTEFYRACLNGANFGQSLNYAWTKANVSNLYYLVFGSPWNSLQ